MCYTTDEYAKPRTEVTYNAKTPYGSDGYSTDCNNILVCCLITCSISIDNRMGPRKIKNYFHESFQSLDKISRLRKNE